MTVCADDAHRDQGWIIKVKVNKGRDCEKGKGKEMVLRDKGGQQRQGELMRDVKVEVKPDDSKTFVLALTMPCHVDDRLL